MYPSLFYHFIIYTIAETYRRNFYAKNMQKSWAKQSCYITRATNEQKQQQQQILYVRLLCVCVENIP